MTKTGLADTRSESTRPGTALVETSPSDDVALDDVALDDVDDHMWPVLEQLARAMRVPDAELAPTLAAVVRMAVETIGPADYAGLVLVVSKAIEPVVVTGEPVRILDEWQQRQGMGPCAEAAQQQHTVTIHDTRAEPRWLGRTPSAKGTNCSPPCSPPTPRSPWPKRAGWTTPALR